MKTTIGTNLSSKWSLALWVALLCFRVLILQAQETKVSQFSIGDKWYYGTERVGSSGLPGVPGPPSGEHDDIAVGVVIYEVVDATETEPGAWHYTISRTIRDCYARDSVALPIYMDIASDGKVWMQEGDYSRNLVHDPNLKVGGFFQVTIRATEGNVNPWVVDPWRSYDPKTIQQVKQNAVLRSVEPNEEMPNSPKVYRYDMLPLSGESWHFYTVNDYVEGIGFANESFYPYRGVFGNPGLYCMCFHNNSPEERLRGFVSVDGDTIRSPWFSERIPIDMVYFSPSTIANQQVLTPHLFTYDANQQMLQSQEDVALVLYNSLGQIIAITQGERLSLSHLPAGVYIVQARKESETPYSCRIFK